MPDDAHRPRAIRTLGDVRSVLDSERASFEELLECVRRSEADRAWDIYERASHRALDAAISQSRIRMPHLIEAARHLAKAIMRRAGTLEDLEARVVEASDSLNSLEPRISARDNLRDDIEVFRQETLTALSELRVLVADPSVDGLLRLCSRLRKWECSDLAVVAGEQARTLELENTAVLTTLGAAYSDLGEYRLAREHLETALRIFPDAKEAITALSRVEYETENFGDSHRLALTAFQLEPDLYSAHRLLASALAMDDDEAFQKAERLVSELGENDAGFSQDGYLYFLSAKVLYDGGQIDEALSAATAVLDSTDTSSNVRHLARNLIKKINSARQGRFRLDEGS